jgi:hypothetical protein
VHLLHGPRRRRRCRQQNVHDEICSGYPGRLGGSCRAAVSSTYQIMITAGLPKDSRSTKYILADATSAVLAMVVYRASFLPFVVSANVFYALLVTQDHKSPSWSLNKRRIDAL